MNTQAIIVGIIALIIGGIGGYSLHTQQPSDALPNESLMHEDAHSSMEGAMNSMTAALEGKSGDEFDKAFLSEMILHHEGAVQMAEAALQHAEHEEIKTMANAIISAQTTEIRQMQDWQKTWYGE